MRDSSVAPDTASAASINVPVMPVSGTFARRSQQEADCPARFPEFT
jgi:hypothetical protein